ncbi:arginine exporter protein ArgO [Micromonospora echinospora]|uniref:Arginine exporter protein ArgO n=1 Tax=Micromonospora echinospora TaxID=1877 RepID=A0ABR6MED7_MICEC|nr:arginine exporter protein ArgO [Micromonospora echinospora]
MAGLALARSVAGARAFLIGAGAIYLVLWLAGLGIDRRDAANVLAVNRADAWLHLLLGAVMLVLGLLAARRGNRG